MNENNIVSIDAVIDRIKIGGYIDCSQTWNYAEDYEYDNILYYLEKYKNLQSKIDKAIEYINTWLVDEYSICVPDKEEPDVFCEYEPNAIDKLLDILKEDK